MKVLVVDDNRDAANSLGMLVGLHGHDVRTAYDGEDALALAVAFHPDLVLLDLGMPVMDGYQVCRRIREQPWGPQVVVVAVTGWGRKEDRLATRGAGFDQHMVKPVAPAAIRALLASLAGPCST